MYEHIHNTDPLVQQVWSVMQAHRGFERRVDRGRLTYHVFGEVNDNLDRKVRDAIAELPIVWSDGYFIPQTWDEAADYIAGMRSRQAAIGQRLRVLDDYLRAQREPVRVEQMQLLEVL
jgi:hypothetical protein